MSGGPPSPDEFMTERLRERLRAAAHDAELLAAAQGLEVTLSLHVGDRVLTFPFGAPSRSGGEFSISAAPTAWRLALKPRPPVGYHSFTAVRNGNGAFAIEGNPIVIAQSLHATERLFELIRAQTLPTAEKPAGNFEAISGRYAQLVRQDNGDSALVYFEQSGTASARPPIVMLHTAGADSRQFRYVLADPELQSEWALYAFDLPFHGRSLPSDGWSGEAYSLTTQAYLEWCTVFLEQVVRRPALIMGCSMGAAISLALAAERPELVAAVVALEAPLRSPGRRSTYLAHPQVNQAAHNPSYVRGLMSPASPLQFRRQAAWIYSQGGYQTYSGDLQFYSDEFDAGRFAPRIDATRTPLILMTGSYDYSATPEASQSVAQMIPGARFVLMPDLGHFPMIENPAAFLAHLKPQLSDLFPR